MKRRLVVLSILIVTMLMVTTSSSLVEASPGITIKLLNPPTKGLLELEVGESYTFDILITSYEPFVVALATSDAYYPGRGVFWHDVDVASQSTTALLHLTMTGKKSTAELVAVCDWPEPGICWDEGVVPVSIVTGARYQGGLAVAQIFTFAVVVP